MRWKRADEQGNISNLMPWERQPDVEQMEQEEWIFSERFDNVEVEHETEHPVTVDFLG